MAARKPVLLITAALAIAAASFLLGSYVFPHAPGGDARATVASPADAAANSPARSQPDALADFGIDVSTSAGMQPTSEANGQTAEEATLDDAMLESLDSPARGVVLGRVVASGDPDDTVEVEAEIFRVALPDQEDSTEVYNLPAGSTVRLVFEQTGPGAESRDAGLPRTGVTVRANVRIEPATSTTPARIAVVDFEVLGSQQ